MLELQLLFWLDPVLKALGLHWTFTSIIHANDAKAAMLSNDILHDKSARKKFVSCFKFAFYSIQNSKTFILMVCTMNVIG